MRGLWLYAIMFRDAMTHACGFNAPARINGFALEVKYVSGLFSAISPNSLDGFEQYPNAIDKMYMRSFVFSLIFE